MLGVGGIAHQVDPRQGAQRVVQLAPRLVPDLVRRNDADADRNGGKRRGIAGGRHHDGIVMRGDGRHRLAGKHMMRQSAKGDKRGAGPERYANGHRFPLGIVGMNDFRWLVQVKLLLYGVASEAIAGGGRNWRFGRRPCRFSHQM